MTEQKKRIGQRIKDARAASRLTQVEVAQKTGIPQSQISDWERGAVMPELASLLTLAPVLGVPVSAFVD